MAKGEREQVEANARAWEWRVVAFHRDIDAESGRVWNRYGRQALEERPLFVNFAPAATSAAL